MSDYIRKLAATTLEVDITDIKQNGNQVLDTTYSPTLPFARLGRDTFSTMTIVATPQLNFAGGSDNSWVMPFNVTETSDVAYFTIGTNVINIIQTGKYRIAVGASMNLATVATGNIFRVGFQYSSDSGATWNNLGGECVVANAAVTGKNFNQVQAECFESFTAGDQLRGVVTVLTAYTTENLEHGSFLSIQKIG